jgi:hypothetical protein
MAHRPVSQQSPFASIEAMFGPAELAVEDVGIRINHFDQWTVSTAASVDFTWICLDDPLRGPAAA